MEASEPQARRDSISMQPAETELIARREQNYNGSGSREVRECKSELNSRMYGLT